MYAVMIQTSKFGGPTMMVVHLPSGWSCSFFVWFVIFQLIMMTVPPGLSSFDLITNVREVYRWPFLIFIVYVNLLECHSIYIAIFQSGLSQICQFHALSFAQRFQLIYNCCWNIICSHSYGIFLLILRIASDVCSSR